jgi:membrane fusion protein, multidrug efflux system
LKTPTNSEQRIETMPPISHPSPKQKSAAPRRRQFVPLILGVITLGVLSTGAVMMVHAEGKTNKVALSETAKPVSVVEVQASQFRPFRSYVGTLAPWLEAKIGPQLVSAYVDTVLVRPGAVVKIGQVVATLDCRTAGATSQAVAMQARALESQQKALADEASRVQGLLDGGFVSPNEAEQKAAQSAAEQAQLLATQAKMVSASLQVNDCVLRAPFDGEVATRTSDPGAFAHPGTAIVSIVDRSTVRIVADAPEVDFEAVAPGTPVKVHLVATNKSLNAVISRRAPAADLATRTVHFEMDVTDPSRQLPVGTTAELAIDVGQPESASEVPLYAATVRGSKASLFVVEQGVAHKRTFAVKGEREGRLFLEPALLPQSQVVTEGRALLNDKDRVTATLEPAAIPISPAAERGKTP